MQQPLFCHLFLEGLLCSFKNLILVPNISLPLWIIREVLCTSAKQLHQKNNEISCMHAWSRLWKLYQSLCNKWQSSKTLAQIEVLSLRYLSSMLGTIHQASQCGASCDMWWPQIRVHFLLCLWLAISSIKDWLKHSQRPVKLERHLCWQGVADIG